MRFKVLCAVCAALLLTAGILVGQEGHPLAGSWHGTVGEGDDILDLTVIMDWDGTELSGLVNPGFEHAALQNARLVSSDWTVTFELDFPNRDGQVERCSVNGAIDRLGSDRRTVSGTWRCGNNTRPFEITRDRDY